MPAGTTLTTEEITRAETYRELGFSFRKIGRTIKRSPGAVQRALKDPKNYRKNLAKRGRKKMHRDVQRKKIAALARNSSMSAAAIKDELLLDCSARTVLNEIKREKLKLRKMKKKPKLTKEHKKK